MVSKAKAGDEVALLLVFHSSWLLHLVCKNLQRVTELGAVTVRLESARAQIECAGKSGKVAQAFKDYEVNGLSIDYPKTALVGANQVQGLSEEVGGAAASVLEMLCGSYCEKGFDGGDGKIAACADSVLAIIPKAIVTPYKNLKDICTSARACTGLATKLMDLGASAYDRIRNPEAQVIALDLNKALTTLKAKLLKSVDGVKTGTDVLNAGKALLAKYQNDLAKFCEVKFERDEGVLKSKIDTLSNEVENHDGTHQLKEAERDGIEVQEARTQLQVFIQEDYGSSVFGTTRISQEGSPTV